MYNVHKLIIQYTNCVVSVISPFFQLLHLQGLKLRWHWNWLRHGKIVRKQKQKISNDLNNRLFVLKKTWFYVDEFCIKLLLCRSYKKLSAIGAWENTKRTLVEVQLKQIEVRNFGVPTILLLLYVPLEYICRFVLGRKLRTNHKHILMTEGLKGIVIS